MFDKLFRFTQQLDREMQIKLVTYLVRSSTFSHGDGLTACN
jgi:hypothetical protein